MQSIPTLLERRDLIGCAPIGSGESGAFVLPALLLSTVPSNVYDSSKATENDTAKSQPPPNKKKNKNMKLSSSSNSCAGEIRSLVLVPSREFSPHTGVAPRSDQHD